MAPRAQSETSALFQLIWPPDNQPARSKQESVITSHPAVESPAKADIASQQPNGWSTQGLQGFAFKLLAPFCARPDQQHLEPREALVRGWPMEPVSKWIDRLRSLPPTTLDQMVLQA
jgi:hypothetical protein